MGLRFDDIDTFFVAGGFGTYVDNPKALSRGAGNTPTLMGFGPDDDQLVIVADAGERIKIVAFWRDEIPEDFQQKPGTKSRRIADQLALTIDVPATVEWSPHVYGNGVMMMASAFSDPVLKDGRMDAYPSGMACGLTREPIRGTEKWTWDSKTRSLRSDWTTDYGIQWTLHPVSASNNTVCLLGFEDGVYSVVTHDWDTGEIKGKTILGRSPIFNTVGGFFIPISETEIYITGVFGPVKITRSAR